MEIWQKMLGSLSGLEDCFEYCRALEKEGSMEVDGEVVYNRNNFKKAHAIVKSVRREAREWAMKGYAEADGLYWKCHLFDAPWEFDSFCLYIEKNRESKKRFYSPRRKQLLPIVQALQDLTDDKLDLLAVSCPPGVGKTTLAIFYLAFIGGKDPELSILGGSHSNSFLRGVYDEILRVLDPNGEYLYNEVFPLSPLCNTNAKDMRADLKIPKRFETFEFSSIGSGNAGKVRASNLLYCDDLVDGIETAMSKDRLDKLWQQYYTDLRQRKIGKCKELHIATRWSIYDPIGRLEEEYGSDPRSRFIRFSAMNADDESNWDYPYSLGFTTEFYRKQRDIMDDASWKALYCNEPIEREGQLYAPDELRTYFSLPDFEPDAVIAVCDTADDGGDYWSMPIAYQYGDNYYIEDFICDNGKPDFVEERVVEKLMKHKVKLARFESNRGGSRAANDVEKRLKEKGGTTSISTRWNQTNKVTRIVMSSPWVKEHCVFKDESMWDREYRTAMTFLTGYTMSGKNKHDDVPDSMSDLSNFVQSFEMNTVIVGKRRF